MNMKLLNILFLLIFSVNLFSQSRLAEVSDNSSSRMPHNFYAAIGGVMVAGGTNFFDAYQEYLGGNKNQFSKSLSFYAGSRLILSNNWNINLSAGYFNARINEFYNQEYANIIEKGNRVINQSIRLDNIPIVASIEFVGFNFPYKTFLGAGLGADIGNFKWIETITPGSKSDKRIGGKWSSGLQISPLLRLSTGINLMFDRHHPEYILHNFLIELRYNMLLRYNDYFSDINKQFLTPIPELEENYFVLPAYFELIIGVSLNFEGN